MKKIFTLLVAGALSFMTNHANAQCYSAVQLDGINDYLHTPFNNYSFSTFTMEMWVNSANFTPNEHYISLYQNSYIVLGGWDSPGYFNTWADGVSPISITSGVTPAINTWHHVAFVYDGSNQIIYINGVAVATVASFGTPTMAPLSFNSGLVIGARYTQDTQFSNSSFADVRIWNVARTQTELNDFMNVNLTGSETGLVAYYRFEDGLGSSTVTDLTGNGNTLTMYNMDPQTDWITTPGFGGGVQGVDVQNTCGPFTWIDGVTYTESNNTATFNIVGGAANGCDSLVTLNLTINNSTTGTDVITACNSYTWIDGETYTESNNTATFNIVGGAQNGCDSLVTLNLTINNSATGIDVITACNSYTWIDGETYTESNNSATFNIVGGAANGCDSLVTLNLTINNSTTGTDVITACNSYTWIDGETYTESNNSATFNIVGGAQNGCDSLVTLNLTINNSTTGTDVIVANNSYTWIDGNTYFADNNTATFNLIGAAANGCDSLVTLNLTIISGNAPSNDQPCGALNITSSGQTDLNTYTFLSDMTCNNPSGNNTSASPGSVGASCGGANGRSMWYTFTTPSCDVNGIVPFEIEISTNNLGTNFNTKLAIFESNDNDCDGVFTELACNDDHNGAGNPALCDAAGATTSTIVTSLQPNKQYWVYVDGFNAEFGDFVLSGRALTAPHGVSVVGNGTQIQLTTTDMGAGLYTYYYKQVGSTGYSTANSQTALSNVRTLAPGNDYITQIMYRCEANFFNQNQWYRTEPQTISLGLTCAVVSDMTCTFNGPNSYTLTWTQPSGNLYTDGGLSGYRIKRSPVGSAGVYTFSNPAVVCENGTCSVTLPGNSPTGFNWTIETRCTANNVQVGNTTSCGPQAPEFAGNNDASNSTSRTLQHTFSFVNAEAGIEFVDVQMHDAYADFGLNTPMIGDYEIYVNDNNEITWRRVDTAVDMNFDFVIVPNPSNAITTLHLSSIIETGSFTIVDAMGRTIQSGSIDNTDNINFDAAQLQSGVYMVVVTVGNMQMTKRLVVAE